MAILRIARMGHPVLLKKAKEVEDIHAPEVQRFLQDIRETCKMHPSTGLAAPQVYTSLRIFCFEIPESLAERKKCDPVPWGFYINPKIEFLTDEMEEDWEVCLSLLDLAGWVPRYKKLRLTALSETGEKIEKEVEGFEAKVIQHEYDHLDGILYPQRMKDFTKLIYKDEIHHWM